MSDEQEFINKPAKADPITVVWKGKEMTFINRSELAGWIAGEMTSDELIRLRNLATVALDRRNVPVRVEKITRREKAEAA